jgi:hypothetical protein
VLSIFENHSDEEQKEELLLAAAVTRNIIGIKVLNKKFKRFRFAKLRRSQEDSQMKV